MSNFDQHANDPFFWFKQATELDKAAMLIWAAISRDFAQLSHAEVGTVIDLKQVPHANLGGVFWLNAGLALENLFKGMIVRDQPRLIVKGAITGPLKTHDLLKLAKMALVDIDATEEVFLTIGTVCVTWAGRYPCSTKPGESPPPAFSEAGVVAYRKMFDRLVGRLGGAVSRGVTFERLA
ncbi:MAG: hypothetical protein IMZ65_01420 [Planctomycetes bacterium]|nr:hypothetical protein [Planctomycetota bacterium]